MRGKQHLFSGSMDVTVAPSAEELLQSCYFLIQFLNQMS